MNSTSTTPLHYHGLDRVYFSLSTEEFVARTPLWTHYLLTGSDSLPATTAQYQHVSITLRSRQLLNMGTWLSETCWATCKGEIKDNTKVTSSWFFLSTLNYDTRPTTHQIRLCVRSLQNYVVAVPEVMPPSLLFIKIPPHDHYALDHST